MIKHIPIAKDFEKAGIDSLCQAEYLIYQIRKKADETHGHHYKSKKATIWTYYQSVLRSCLISLFQGLESLMKSEICKNSPFLLIEDKRKDWSTLPEAKDNDFDSYYTIAGESLIKTFFAVQKCIKVKSKKIEFYQLFEELRSKRNKATHGLLFDGISPEYIISCVLRVFTLFYSKDKWLQSLKENFKEDPLIDIFDKEVPIALSNENVDFIEEFIGKSEMNNYLTTNINKRRYFCPNCHESLLIIYNESKSKWAFLETKENKLRCLICNRIHDITRNDCQNENCKGNVIYKKKLCLTCGTSNSN